MGRTINQIICNIINFETESHVRLCRRLTPDINVDNFTENPLWEDEARTERILGKFSVSLLLLDVRSETEDI